MTDQAHGKQLRPVLIVAAVIVAILAGAFYTKMIADARMALASTDSQQPPIKVLAYTVKRLAMPIRIHVRGFLEGFAEVRVHAEVAGRVAKRSVDDGASVEAGTELCRIDETFHQIAVAQAEAQRANARALSDQSAEAINVATAQIDEAEAIFENAKVEFERIAELREQQNAPMIEYSRTEAAYQKAEAAVRQSRAALQGAVQKKVSAAASVALADANLEQARQVHERCSIRSPLTGRVDRMLVEQGEYVMPAQPIADVIRLDRLKFFIELSARQLAALGDEVVAEIVPDGQPGRTYDAIVDHLAPRADPISRKFRLQLHVDNADGALLAGMFAECRLTTSSKKQTIILPVKAVTKRFSQNFCRVILLDQEPHRVEFRRIETKPMPDRLELVEVLSGLEPGDLIVVEAQSVIRDGDAVTVNEMHTLILDLPQDMPEDGITADATDHLANP